MAESKRITVFIDGPNLNQAQGRYQQGYRVDLAKLIERIIGKVKTPESTVPIRKLVAIHYYGSERGSRQTRFAKIRGAYNFQFHQCRFGKKEDVDMALAVDMLDEAWRNLYDIAILVSGDQDFILVVRKIKRQGKEVEIASFENCLASSLRQEASDIIILDLHASYIRMA